MIVETPPEEKKETRCVPKESKSIFESSPAASNADITSASRTNKAADAEQVRVSVAASKKFSRSVVWSDKVLPLQVGLTTASGSAEGGCE